MNCSSISATGRLRIGVLALVLAALAPATSSNAADTAKGLRIMQEQDRRDAGWRTVRVNGEMILQSGSSTSASRAFRLVRTERPSHSKGDNSRLTFATPADVKGTVLLTHGNVEPKDDHQWLYLPATRKARRISSGNRSGKFLSSEFSYEDMGGSELQDNTYGWLRDESCPVNTKLSCHVVAAYPKNKKSGYKQRILWLDTQEYRVFQTEYFNKRGKLEKRMTGTGFKNYGGHWRPDQLDMLNLQTGKRTILKWSGYKFGVSVSSTELSPQRLDK
ncbi:outer membrane lipoprotein-sorting protein [Cognatishimia activa]|uniref:outer membrane lipoprotein-sorting protein n=1 Tax=Cognatishimia activa TaxID=1715691 RepID=UPI002230FB61|nr:outer membrane lipoprotein-sorting protein [Cognatishimia activa]UZD90807.1 outer membrane lipoprotein-sorting protein [Cognatishimia activa]